MSPSVMAKSDRWSLEALCLAKRPAENEESCEVDCPVDMNDGTVACEEDGLDASRRLCSASAVLLPELRARERLLFD